MTVSRKAGRVLAAASGGLLLATCSSGGVLLPSGEPDPGYNGGAMQVWLRADSGVVTDSGAVSAWIDRSNHGNDAVQAVPGNRPMPATSPPGVKPLVHFAGNGDRLEFATGFDSVFDGSFTLFTVVAPDDGDPNRDDVWFGLVSADGQDRIVQATDGNVSPFTLNQLYRTDGNSANTIVNPAPYPDGPQSRLTVISCVVTAGDTHHAYTNGNPAAAASADGSGVNNANFASGDATAFLGSANDGAGNPWPTADTSFAGSIAEFILYDGALGAADREAVEDYLLAYWQGPPGVVRGPDHRPLIDRASNHVQTVVSVNPWFPLNCRAWDTSTPDRPTTFGITVPEGDVIRQYEAEIELAEQYGVDALMIESMTSGAWWPVTPTFMQAADNVGTGPRIGIFITGGPEGDTAEEKRHNFTNRIRGIVDECSGHTFVWRIDGKPVVMLYRAWSVFSPSTWRDIQTELDAEGKDCIWLMSDERVGWDIPELADYLPVMDGVAHYANYGLAGFQEHIADSMIPWMQAHYPQKLIYPGVQQNHAQSWSFAGGGSDLTGPARGMCEAALAAGVDGLHFTNWSDFIENSRFVPSEMGDCVLAELIRHYGWVLQGANPRDEREQPLFALSYLDSTVHGRDLAFELLAFPFQAGSSGSARITIRDGNGGVVTHSAVEGFSMTELSEVRFEFATAGWPYRYTLTPEAEIEFLNGSSNEAIVLRGPYMLVSPDRPANKLARSVCSSSVLALDACSVVATNAAPGTHHLLLNVQVAQTCDELRLVRNAHVIQTWTPAATNWEEELTIQRGAAGFRAGAGELLPGVPPFDIYHLEAWAEEKRAWSDPLVVHNVPGAGSVETPLVDGVIITAPRNAFVTSRYSFDALVDRLVPDESGFDFHGALGAGALNGKSRGFGYTGHHTAGGVFHLYHGGSASAPAWVEGGVDGSRCLEFDGVDDYLFFWSNILPEDSWTIAAAVLPAEHPGDVLTLWSTRTAGMAAYLDTDGKPVAEGWTPAAGWQVAVAPEPLLPNGWRHIACTYDCHALRLFVGGQQVATVIPDGHVAAGLPYLMVGCRLNYLGEKSAFFKGKMDNLLVTGRALGEDEIGALVPGPPPILTPILSGGEPDPAYDDNAMQVWLRADSGVTTLAHQAIAFMG